VHCRQCGYDLKGLPVSSRCPECGLDALETITHLVDPEASRLPRLRDPAAVGAGLLGLSATYFLMAALVLLPRALPTVLAALGLEGRSPAWVVPPRAVAAAVGLLGLWWLHLLVRSPAEEPADPARRATRWMWRGQIGWSLAVLSPLLGEWGGLRERVLLAPLEVASVPFAIATLVGLRGILQLVGLRSRAYRNAKGGRQSIDALVGAILAGAAGNLGSAIGLWQEWPWLETVGQTLFGASAGLLLLGLLYLVVNCWWIRSSLRKPPPRLEELVSMSG